MVEFPPQGAETKRLPPFCGAAARFSEHAAAGGVPDLLFIISYLLFARSALLSAPLPKPVFVFLYGQGGDFNVLDAGPAVAALDEGDKGVEGGTLALGLQRDAAVPVVGDPAGQAQMQGCGAGIIAEAYALHCAGEAPAAADGAHASMPVTV